MSDSVALGHPERVGGQPQALRWTTVGATLPTGWLVAVPGPLGTLMAQGVITDALTEPHGVWLWLDREHRWRDHAEDIRDALASACRLADQWEILTDEDKVLAAIVDDILHGELADFIESHGGNISLLGVRGRVVTVELSGACAHCALADVTLRTRVEAAVRRRFPQLVELRDATSAKPHQLFSFLTRGPVSRR